MAYALWSYIRRLPELFPQSLNRRHWLVFFVAVVAGGWFLSAHSAQALGGMQDIVNGMIQFLAWLMLILANMAIGLTVFFLRFFVAIASYNDYINVAVVQLGWTMVRDVANMFFVVALLVIAFGTILGLEEYEWKKNLVKLIFAAIFINFSNLICQLIIDVAHVFTITFLNAVSATAGGNLINMFKLSEITSMVGANTGPGTFLNWTDGGYFVEILGGALAAVIFAVVAAAAMGSYAFVMMVRVVSLWALIILSPLAYIMGVLPSTKSYADKWWSEFGKHVIVAPIMVFFLWLSFATLGTGDIINSIQQNIPERDKINQQTQKEFGYTTAGAEQGGTKLQNGRLSLSKVTTWESMANFLIAIFFMYAGIKATEETGVAGSDMIGDAVSFGKKVTTYATGEALGRWVMGKGREHGGGLIAAGIDKVPLLNMIGPRGIGRAFRSATAIASRSADKTGELRNRGAKYLEEKRDKMDFVGKYTTGLAHGILARLLETSGRKEKRVEDWEKGAEAQKHITEETYSTSSSRAGKTKLELQVREHQVDEFNKAKKDEKFAAMEKQLMDTEHGGIFGKREKEMFKSRAAAEEINKNVNREKELATAKARDAKLKENNKTPRYVEAVQAKFQKEDMELAGSSDYDRTMAKVNFLRNEVARITTALATGVNVQDGDSPEKLANLKEEMSSLHLFNLNRGPIFAGGGQGRALRGLGTHNVQNGDVVQEQALELSALLQEDVQATEAGVGRALDILKQRKGEQYESFMRAYVAGLAKSADEGMVNKAGLFRESFDESTGESRFEAVRVLDDAEITRRALGAGTPEAAAALQAQLENERGWSKGKRDWAVAQSTYNTLQGFEGAVDTVDGKVRIDSESARKNVATMFGSIRENVVNSVKQTSLDTFNAAFENAMGAGGGGAAEIEEIIKAMAKKATSPDGIVALLKKTNLNNVAAGIDVARLVTQNMNTP